MPATRPYLILLFTLMGLSAHAQQSGGGGKPVEIIYAGSLEGFTTATNEPARKLLRDAAGQVQMRQSQDNGGRTTIWADSVIQYEQRNYIQFMGNVRVEMPNENGSTGTLTCSRMDYDSGTRILDAYDNVVLTDQGSTLTTNYLRHFRATSFSMYRNGGTITDPENILTSTFGYYYSTTRKATFRGEVRVNNPQYTLRSDTLDYETATRTAYFVAPTWMDGKGSSIGRSLWTKGGWYRTPDRVAYLYPRARLSDTSYTIYGDTLYFEDARNSGWAHCNVELVNKDTSIAIFGERGIFDRAAGSSRIYDHAFLIQRYDTDTLTMFADTLFSVDDSAAGNRRLRAYYNVRFAMREMQGKADSLEYNRIDSQLVMFRDPIIWAGASQLTGDTIHLWLKNKQLDSLWVHRNAFMTSAENIRDYNQISSKMIHGRFDQNELRWMLADGQAEMIYFTKDDTMQTGMSRTRSRALWMTLADQQPDYIRLVEGVEGTTYPMHEIALEQNFLRGFKWRGAERPRRYLLPDGPRLPALIDPRYPPNKQPKQATASTSAPPVRQ